MVIVLEGNIPVKKNSKQIIYVRGKPIIISSKSHKEWHTRAMWQLKAQRLKPIKGPVKIEMVAEFKTKRKKDLDGVLSSILDLLVDAGIIEDDTHTIVKYISILFAGYGPKTIITIQEYA